MRNNFLILIVIAFLFFALTSGHPSYGGMIWTYSRFGELVFSLAFTKLTTRHPSRSFSTWCLGITMFVPHRLS